MTDRLNNNNDLDLFQQEVANGQQEVSAAAGDAPTLPKIYNYHRDVMLPTHTPMEPLVHGLVRRGETAMIWSPAGVGKSWVASTIAVIAANGISDEQMLWTSDKKHKVFFIDGEMGFDENQQRLKLILQGFPDATTENIDGINLRESGSLDFDLTNPAYQALVLNEIDEGGYDLVIIDNISSLCLFNNENDSAEITPFNKFLDALHSRNISAIAVHHTGKLSSAADRQNAHNLRGSSAFERAIALGLSIYEVEEYSAETGVMKMGFKAYKRRWKNAITSGGIIVDDLCGVSVESEIPVNLMQDGWLLQHEKWIKGEATDYPTEWTKLCAPDLVSGKEIKSNHKRAYETRVANRLIQRNSITVEQWEAFKAIIDDK